jgi:predicted RNase H-like HicB family nuclease
MNHKYAVVYEKGPTSIGAYVPDLPGCVAVADNLAEAERLIREAIELHVAGMIEDGQPVPLPTTRCDYIEAKVPVA